MSKEPHSNEAILEQLRKITSSSLFEKAGRSRALLEYLVHESLSGRAELLKEYTIGAEGMGKGDSFDPRTDTIVRAEASRLRGRLERYYAAEGEMDPLLIVLPKGSYMLDFREPNRSEESVGILPRLKPDGRFAWAVGALVILCLIGFLWWKRVGFTKQVEPSRLTLEVELKVPGLVGSVVGTNVVISPDGARLVFAVQGKDGVSRLYVHDLDRSRARELPGTEGARAQFFSSDGKWIGFWAAGQIKKTPLDGGSPVVLCEAPDLQGASWAEDDSIFAAFGDDKLWRIPASGGAPRQILDGAKDTFRPSAPQVLSGQNAVLFTSVGGDPAQNKVAVYSLSTGETKVVAQGSTYGRYLPNGYLTYVRQGTLYAAPFDLKRLATTGTAVPLLDGVAYDSTFGHAQLDFSQTGTAVYRRNGGATVAWLDETGRTEPILSNAGQYVWPQLSPDGSQLAVTASEGGVAAVWIHDLTTRQFRRVATGPMHFCLWSPDGRYLVLGGGSGLTWIRTDQSVEPRLLLPGGIQIPASFTHDGTQLAFHALDAGTHFDLWTVPIQYATDGLVAGEPKVFLRTSAIETYPAFSLDGRWVAYASSESGTSEVYVRSFPEGAKAIRVSTAGGRVPRWSPTRPELFYRTDQHTIMAATYATKAGIFKVEGVRPWSAKRLFDTGVLANYDVGRDGRVAVLLPSGNIEDRQSENHVTVVLNFFEQVRRQVSSRADSR